MFADEEYYDPALIALLARIDYDISKNRGLHELPLHLIKAMQDLSNSVPVSLDEILEGGVAI